MVTNHEHKRKYLHLIFGIILIVSVFLLLEILSFFVLKTRGYSPTFLIHTEFENNQMIIYKLEFIATS